MDGIKLSGAPQRSILGRHEAIMLQKLSIMLLSSAPKITYSTFEKMSINPTIMPLMLANNSLIRP